MFSNTKKANQLPLVSFITSTAVGLVLTIGLIIEFKDWIVGVFNMLFPKLNLKTLFEVVL